VAKGAKGVVRERTRVFFHHQLLVASANPSRSGVERKRERERGSACTCTYVYARVCEEKREERERTGRP